MNRMIAVYLVVAAAVATPVLAADSCPFSCGDLSGDNAIDLTDYAVFADCIGEPPASSQDCYCSDVDGSGTVDLRDFALLSLVFGQASDEVPPGCTGALGTTAEMTAYRPQHGAGYTQFVRTPIADAEEQSPALGPGIRMNAPGDTDPAGEDDLIEVELAVDPPGAQLALRRSNPALSVWTTRDRQAGTDITFVDDKSGTLPFGPSESQLTVWVEWSSSMHGTADLHIEPLATTVPKDTLTFHTFHGIVMALGGEGQVPSAPPDPQAGTFVVAETLYRQGYDVHVYDEDNVSADGSGAVYDEIVNAVQNRGVNDVSFFGYSHGGGSTYSLADRLDVNRASIGVFEIEYTSYVDSVRNNSDLDVAQELRRPPSTAYHLNHYQHGSFFEDLGLDGGPVPDSSPPPTGLDVETTPWGATSDHFEVDDFVEVLDLIDANLTTRVTR